MRAIDKVFVVLDAFIGEREMRLSDLSAKTGLNITTTYNVASALVENGFLVQSEKRGKYSLGMRFLEFADEVKQNISIREVAMPFLDSLCRAANENVSLMILDGNTAAVVASVEADHMFGIAGKWSVKIPLHSTAGGNVLAAYMSESDWAAIRESLPLVADTANTITDLSAFEERLEKVRAEGIAVDDEEAGIGIRAIAAPIMDNESRVVASVDVIGPKMRITDERLEEVKQLVKQCALDMSGAIGYREMQPRRGDRRVVTAAEPAS